MTDRREFLRILAAAGAGGTSAAMVEYDFDVTRAVASIVVNGVMYRFGSDFSPEPIESTVNELPGLKLTKEFEQMLLRGNAERLFPRFKV